MREQAAPAAAELDAEEKLLLERGIAQFNDRLFYECHDTLEELWSGLRGPSRSFVQGLIQIAVGFHHLGSGNRTGGQRLLGRGLDRLAPYPAGYLGLDKAGLHRAVALWQEALLSGRPLPEEPPPRLGVAADDTAAAR